MEIQREQTPDEEAVERLRRQIEDLERLLQWQALKIQRLESANFQSATQFQRATARDPQRQPPSPE